ncbi:MAG TPA: hypothetical protein VF384_08185 [Planctomycetota bacterium]
MLASDSPVPDSGPASWSLLRRLLFRFVFVYLVVYCLPFPLGLIPEADVVAKHFEDASNVAVTWFGSNVLGLEKNLAPFETGSGDTTRDYVTLAMYVSIALVIAGFWSLLSVKASYPRLADLLRTYVRFVLAFAMLRYGTGKFFGGQFPSTDSIWLVSSWGESSPMGVVWKFMYASPTYTAFTGVVECLGGLLLLSRYTTTLGAMVSAGAMLNVVMLNFCYDVPVKLYSAHLLLMAIGLLLRDVPRLTAALVLHRSSVPPPLRLPLPMWIFVPERVVKFALVGWLLFVIGQSTYQSWERRTAPPGPLEGLYEVAEFARDGAVVPPLLTEASRWWHVYVGKKRAQVAMTDAKTIAYYEAAVDEAQSTVTLTRRPRPDSEEQAPAPIVLRYRSEAPEASKPEVTEAAAPQSKPEAVETPAKPDQAPAAPTPAVIVPEAAPAVTPVPTPAAATPSTERLLVLEGTFDGAAITVRLRKRPGDSFRLRNHGFHWINEYPFNR